MLNYSSKAICQLLLDDFLHLHRRAYACIAFDRNLHVVSYNDEKTPKKRHVLVNFVAHTLREKRQCLRIEKIKHDSVTVNKR